MLFPVILIGYYLRETNLDNINLLSEVNFSLILGYNVDEARASICPKQAMALQMAAVAITGENFRNQVVSGTHNYQSS